MSAIPSRILTLFSRTPVHLGAGNSVGAIDSPIMRERHTRIPVIPGSSLKGVLADLWNDPGNTDRDDKGKLKRKENSEAVWLFGSDDNASASAGSLLIGEARVLAFPVRSAKGGFAWISCPLALSRYKRDTGADFNIPEGIGSEECIAPKDLDLSGNVVLEEYCLKRKGDNPVAGAIKGMIVDAVWEDMDKRFVVVSDEMFSYFVEQACEIVTRVRIDDETGVVAPGALFNQENVPSETLFYAVISAQDEKKKSNGKIRTAVQALETLQEKLKSVRVIQVGGDETIGLGFCSIDVR